jgi:hypothetical protein
MGYPINGIFDNPRLQRIIRGIKRFHGEADTRERLPITRDILLQLLQCLPHWSSDLAQANLYAAFCVAFSGFLRAGEFTWSSKDQNDLGQFSFARWHVTRQSVTFAADRSRVYLCIPASKSDTFRHGVTITLAATGDAACPVAALRNLFDNFPQPAPSNPLFTRAYGRPFSRQYLIAALRACLKHLGIVGHYSGHSFRRGAATSARRAGLSDSEIQMLGRWHSDAYKRYIDTHPEQLYLISRRHQLAGSA